MGLNAGGGSNSNLKVKSEEIGALVVNDVHVKTTEYEVKVPKFIEHVVEVPKYVNKEIIVTHVNVETKTVYTQTVEVENRVVETEKVVFRDVIIDRPIFRNSTVEVKDVVVKKVEMPIEVPRITEKIVIKEIPIEVKTYKLVEELIRVPKIMYVPTEIERVVWKDVPRERCSHCGKPV